MFSLDGGLFSRNIRTHKDVFLKPNKHNSFIFQREKFKTFSDPFNVTCHFIEGKCENKLNKHHKLHF